MRTGIRQRQFFFRTFAFCGFVAIATVIVAGCPSSDSTSDNNNSANNANESNNTSRPIVSAPADQIVECDGSGNQAALMAWLSSATFTDGCGAAILRNDYAAGGRVCGAAFAATVTWTATDRCGNPASDSATFTVVDTTAPTLSVPQPISVNCGDDGTAAALNAWLASASASDACGDVTITSRRFASPGNCTATISWTATDDCGNSVSASSTYTTVGDTAAPAMALIGGSDLTIECGVLWEDPGATTSDVCDALVEATVTGDVDWHTPGAYLRTYAAIDACGNMGPTIFRSVTVVDTLPPVVTVSAPKELWPPNHKMQSYTLADLMTIVDACEGELNPNIVGTIIDIYSDEPDNDTGDGNAAGDIVIADDHSFSVRAERKGNGSGRVYGIRFSVSDASGNTVERTAYVHVPHDQSGGAVTDDGASSGQVVTR